MKLNLTTGQWLAILVGVLSALAGATAQLTPVFGATAANLAVSVANLAMTVLVTPVLFVITGQSGQLRAVGAMPGVDKIVVNKDANKDLATMAVAQEGNKVEASPEAKDAVAATAKGSTP